FNSAQTLADMNDYFTVINQYIDKSKKINKDEYELILKTLEPVKTIFSLFTETPNDYIEGYKNRVTARLGLDRKEIDNMLTARNTARKNKDFATADQIRNDLLKKGITIMDAVDGSADWLIS
ncbi:MAG: hypothetical protein V1647_05515, partial [Pseudomonadota bacterium]